VPELLSIACARPPSGAVEARLPCHCSDGPSTARMSSLWTVARAGKKGHHRLTAVSWSVNTHNRE